MVKEIINFEFTCPECKHLYAFLNSDDNPVLTCPKCGKYNTPTDSIDFELHDNLYYAVKDFFDVLFNMRQNFSSLRFFVSFQQLNRTINFVGKIKSVDWIQCVIDECYYNFSANKFNA